MLRKASLAHDGLTYQGTIRNISASGALIEGLWDVPVDTAFELQLTKDQTVTAITRWCAHGRLGVQFAKPLAIGAKSPADKRKAIAPAPHPPAKKAAR